MKNFLSNKGFYSFWFYKLNIFKLFTIEAQVQLRDELGEFKKVNEELEPEIFREKLLEKYKDFIINQRLINITKEVTTIKNIMIFFLVITIISIIVGIICGVELISSIDKLKYH